MTKDAILESVNKVFKDIFDDENIVINRSTTANDVDGWDSLTHITIISSVPNVRTSSDYKRFSRTISISFFI